MKLFIKDHLWVILLFVICHLIFILIEELDGITNSANLFYYCILSTFFLLVFLLIRYYRNKNMYKLLSNPKNKKYKSLEKSSLPTALCRYLEHREIEYYEVLNNYKEKQDQHILFVNRWIHYLKTPLSVIQLIYQENEVQPIVNSLQNETDKILDGLNMALYYSRADSLKQDLVFESININDAISFVVNDLKRFFIRKSVFPELLINKNENITSDLKWFRFIVYQLLTNAIKYSDKKNSKIIISYSDKILSIKDNGIGIPSKDIKRIFDMFYTGYNGRKMGESTGVGLYLVKKVCEDLNYKIEVITKIGSGTEFLIHL
ncbi:HAMP domain-containing histidine kinase [Marinilabiliaceae bacterium JC040]|nr:HAMP domain-containing histidine kinase [Marinilabiliaceae bacterium JC040]